MRRRTLFGSIIVGYGEWEINISANPSTIENTGGTVAISATASRLVYWSDKSVTTEEGIPTISVSAGNLSNNVLTLGANTSTSVKTIIITATYEGTTQTLDISQAGKTIKSYSDWTVTVSANPASGISAAGGTSIITRNASRIATWTDDSTTTETATPSLSTDLGDISDNTLTIPANQTTNSRSATITATHSGKSATCIVSQNADSVAAYGDVNLTVGTIADVPASGGSRTSTGSNATQVLTWVSGRTTTVYPTITEGTISNVGSKGTTVSDRTSLGTVTITATGQGSKSASKTLTVYQQANSASYGAVSISSHGSAIDIPAAGGDRTASGGSGTQKVTYTSGSERAGTVTCGSYSKVSASSLGTTEKARTHVGTSTATLTGEGGKKATVSVAVYQAANGATLSSISAWASSCTNVPTSYINQADWIAAGGGTIYGYCQANYTWTSTSTSTANVTSSTTWTHQGNYGSISGNAFTAPSRGTTTGDNRYNYIYASYGGKSSSFNTGQQYNSATYGNVTVSSHGSASDIPASGGTIKASGGSGKQTITYTSGSTRAGSVSCGGYSGVSANSLGTTTKSRTHIGNSTATLTGEGSKTATVSVAVYQAANAVTNSAYQAYNGNYWASCSIGSGITAAGGSATVSKSAGHTYYYRYLYTSGSVAPSTTTYYSSAQSDNCTIAIVSNGNNRFSLSGTTLKHSSMTTNLTTDTCTVRCTNSASTSVTKDASVSATNSRTRIRYAPLGTPSLSASSTSVTAAKNTVTLTDVFSMWSEYSYTSGSTDYADAIGEGVTYSITSGSSYASLSNNTLTINANTGSSSRSVTVQAKGQFTGQTASVTITQAAGVSKLRIENLTPIKLQVRWANASSLQDIPAGSYTDLTYDSSRTNFNVYVKNTTQTTVAIYAEYAGGAASGILDGFMLGPSRNTTLILQKASVQTYGRIIIGSGLM